MPIIFGGIHFESGHPISNPIGWLMNYVFRCKHSSVIISTMIDYLISKWWWGKLSGHSTFFPKPGSKLPHISCTFSDPTNITNEKLSGLGRSIRIGIRTPLYWNILIFSLVRFHILFVWNYFMRRKKYILQVSKYP